MGESGGPDPRIRPLHFGRRNTLCWRLRRWLCFFASSRQYHFKNLKNWGGGQKKQKTVWFLTRSSDFNCMLLEIFPHGSGVFRAVCFAPSNLCRISIAERKGKHLEIVFRRLSSAWRKKLNKVNQLCISTDEHSQTGASAVRLKKKKRNFTFGSSSKKKRLNVQTTTRGPYAAR